MVHLSVSPDRHFRLTAHRALADLSAGSVFQQVAVLSQESSPVSNKTTMLLDIVYTRLDVRVDGMLLFTNYPQLKQTVQGVSFSNIL